MSYDEVVCGSAYYQDIASVLFRCGLPCYNKYPGASISLLVTVSSKCNCVRQWASGKQISILDNLYIKLAHCCFGYAILRSTSESGVMCSFHSKLLKSQFQSIVMTFCFKTFGCDVACGLRTTVFALLCWIIVLLTLVIAVHGKQLSSYHAKLAFGLHAPLL